MDKLKEQFLDFINTPFLFKEINGLTQIELNINEINAFDFSLLNIPNKLPLGKRIEHFFKFYIEQSKHYDLIKNNIQIIHNKETLGEIDFLIYDKPKQKHIHVEHVYKYYLYDDSFENEIDRFIGPNRDDSFAKKLTKLQQKQLPLLYKKQTQPYLKNTNVHTFEQRVCFKGNVYLPMHLLHNTIPIINNACIRGFYINHDEFFKQKQFKNYEYFLPARYDWPSKCSRNETWKTFDEVKEEIKLILSYKKSTLVWMKNKKENKCHSFFVTWW